MRKINLIFNLLLLLGIAYFSAVNFDNNIVLNIKDFSGNLISQNISLAVFTLAILFIGLYIGAGIVHIFLSVQGEKLKAYKRELEKSSVVGSDNASRVEVLEAKIETLEKAFNTVIDERTQLEVQIKSLNAELDRLNNK